LHAFNTSACVIWCHLEEDIPPPVIAETLAKESGLDEATARAHADAALADWLAKGLLTESPTPPLASPPPTVIRDLPPPPKDGAAESRAYRMLGVVARLRFAETPHGRMVDPLFAHMAYDGPDAADFVVDIAPVGDTIGLWLDGEAAASCERDNEMAPAAKAVVWTAVLLRQEFLIHIMLAGPPAVCCCRPRLEAASRQ
jgi:hypothetical protein